MLSPAGAFTTSADSEAEKEGSQSIDKSTMIPFAQEEEVPTGAKATDTEEPECHCKPIKSPSMLLKLYHNQAGGGPHSEALPCFAMLPTQQPKLLKEQVDLLNTTQRPSEKGHQLLRLDAMDSHSFRVAPILNL